MPSVCNRRTFIQTRPLKKGGCMLSVTDAKGRHVEVWVDNEMALDLGVDLAKCHQHSAKEAE